MSRKTVLLHISEKNKENEEIVDFLDKLVDLDYELVSTHSVLFKKTTLLSVFFDREGILIPDWSIFSIIVFVDDFSTFTYSIKGGMTRYIEPQYMFKFFDSINIYNTKIIFDPSDYELALSESEVDNQILLNKAIDRVR